MAKDENRCWPGYEPVPGKRPNEQGSCRKKPKSRLTPKGKRVRAKRRRELDKWKKEHPGSKRSAAQGSASKSKSKSRSSKPRSGSTKKRSSAKSSRSKSPRRKKSSSSKKSSS